MKQNDKIRVSKILREFNIGLNTFNNELSFLDLPKLSINSILSRDDYDFLREYFSSNELKDIDTLLTKITKKRKILSLLFLHNIVNLDNLGVLRKRQLFNFIQQKESSNILCPKFDGYTESNYSTLLRWYKTWCMKPKRIQKEEIEKASKLSNIDEDYYENTKKSNSYNTIDYEAIIFGALRDGNGDLFGF